MFEDRRQSGGAHSPNTHWFDSFAALHKKALAQGIILSTNDLLPVQDADIVVFMEQPNSPHDVVRLKQDSPHLKTVMVLLETSLGARYAFNPRNHQGYDAVLTYDERLLTSDRYFPMRTRAYLRERVLDGPSFDRRRVGCLVGTNRKMRYRSGIMTMKKGWHFSLADWHDYVFCTGELVSYRSEVGRLCAQYDAGAFDIFGEGWDLHPETSGKSLSPPTERTLSYIRNYRYYFAFENHEGENSLISERIWDALWADTVPVYRGNKNVHRHVPRDCYIDANKFKSPKAMLDWLVNSSEDEWQAYRKAGRDFIQSTAVEKYLPDACADELLQPIVLLANQIRS